MLQTEEHAPQFDRRLPDGVRVATPADEVKLYDCLLALYKDNFLGFSISDAKVWAHIKHCTRGGGGIAAIIEQDGKIVASTGIIFSTMWYSENPYLSELWLFVRPEYRRHGHADRLAEFLHFYRDQCRSSENGRAIPLITSVTSMTKLPAKMRWWQKWSKLVGGIYAIDGM